jgi:integrase/recombinase XerD
MVTNLEVFAMTLPNAPQVRRTLPAEVYSEDEVQRLVKACSQGKTGVRNRALITVLYRAGLRISEALDLLPKDLDPDAGTVRVLHGKGNKARTVGMDPGRVPRGG